MYPGVNFSPISTRAQKAVEAVRQAKSKRGDVGIIFAVHITSPPQVMMDNLKKALDAGVNGVMFSEYYSGGAVRAVREFTKTMGTPPAIYGHNGGITARTRHIYREVLDMLARLDGMDFRQTAPLAAGRSLLRPHGLEWRKCEEMLTKPLGSKPAVMIARAGGLDQGNIIQNLLDIEKCGDIRNYLFLAGSAINTIKDETGHYDPSIGAKAMDQIVEIYEKNIFRDISSCTVDSIKRVAAENSYHELVRVLDQRYKK
jgi:ribulose 1,5-bisphosphate carboxylase large subunit-like protein